MGVKTGRNKIGEKIEVNGVTEPLNSFFLKEKATIKTGQRKEQHRRCPIFMCTSCVHQAILANKTVTVLLEQRKKKSHCSSTTSS